MMRAAIVGVPRIRFGRCQPLAGVLDQPRPGGDRSNGERPQPMNWGLANPERERGDADGRTIGPPLSDLEAWIAQRYLCSTSVTPPEMMNAITSGASASIRVTREAGTTRIWPAKPYDCGIYTVA